MLLTFSPHAMNTLKSIADPAQLKALTSLTPPEFNRLLGCFEDAFRRKFKMYQVDGKRRRKPLSAQRLANPSTKLPTKQDRLLFILLALKTDAIQQHLAATFGMTQTAVSKWYRFLLPVLDKALGDLGCRPARTLCELSAQLHHTNVLEAPSGANSNDEEAPSLEQHNHAEQPTNKELSLHLDVTERRMPRNTDYEAQKKDYNGKFKHHAVKNAVMCSPSQRIVYLGPTWRGAMHDKRMADEELPTLESLDDLDLWLTLDAGYTGYEPDGVWKAACMRASRGNPLKRWQKNYNKWVSSMRIVVEHAIGGIKRMAKATRLRTSDIEHADQVMQLAADLHNYRVAMRPETYRNSHVRTQARLHPFGC